MRRCAHGVDGDQVQYLDAHPEVGCHVDQGVPLRRVGRPQVDDRGYWRNRGIRVVQGWGMTETNPVASMAYLKPQMEDWDIEDQLDRLETAGSPSGLQVKIVDEIGEELAPRRGGIRGAIDPGPLDRRRVLQRRPDPQSFEDGWLRTGDVCKITPEGTSGSQTGRRT